MKKYFLISLLLCFQSLWLSAQNSCANLDFEKGAFDSWVGVYGINSQNDYEVENPTNGFTGNGQINNTEFDHSIIDSQRGYTWTNFGTQNSPVGVDPYVRTLSLSPPWGGRYVSRLGKMEGDDTVGELSYTIDVDENNALLQVYFAIVLEAPTHSPTQNPYFKISLEDDQGNSVDCVEYIQEGNASATGFLTHNADDGPDNVNTVTYRPWTINSINLLPYVGKQVKLSFAAGGCELAAHMGYAYVDARCSKPQLLKSEPFVCEGTSVTLTAPDGMDSYQWRSGSATGPVISGVKTATVTSEGVYFCTMVPASTANTNCPFTLSVVVDKAPSEPTANFDVVPQISCPGTEFSFTDKSTTDDGSALSSYTWNFGDGSATSSLKNPKHVYATLGTYTVTLKVISADGCIDEISKTIKVEQGPIPQLSGPLILCENAGPTQYNSTASGAWSGTGISAGGIFNPASVGLGTYTFSFTDNICGESNTITVEVKAKPDAGMKPLGPFCEGDAAAFIIPNVTGGSFSGIGVVGNKFDPKVSGPGNHQVFYELTNSNGCKNNSVIVVVVKSNPEPVITDPGSFCTIDPPRPLNVSIPGGTWRGSAVSPAGIFTPSAANVGTNEIIYDITTGCPGSDTIYIQVNANPSANFTLPAEVCEGDAVVTISPDDGGGVFTGTGIVDAQNGKFDPSVAWEGEHIITYEIFGSCGDKHQETIKVIAIKDATFQEVPTMCVEGDVYQFIPTTPGGFWSGNFVNADGTFDPKVSGVGEFVVAYSFGGLCPSSHNKKFEVIAKKSANFSAIPVQCIANPNVVLQADFPEGTWSGSGIVNATTGEFSPAVAGEGSHTITYTIAGLCGDAVSKTVTVVDAPSPNITPVGAMCADAGKVTLNAQPAGGDWYINGGISAPEFDPQIYGPGTHEIKYEIIGTCTAQDIEQITVATPISLAISSAQNESCFGACDGEIIATATGGFSTLSYAWTDAAGTNVGSSLTLSNLCASSGVAGYNLLVKDQLNCSAQIAAQITGPTAPLNFTVDGLPASCGQSNGKVFIDVPISGGTPNYALVWEDENGVAISTASQVDNLRGNISYTATYTDDNGCVLSQSFFVDDTPGPTVPESILNVSCKSGSDGSVSIDVNNVNGGNAPYNYVWKALDGNQISADATVTGLNAGKYIYELSDVDGCNTSDTLEVLEPDSVELNIVSDNPLFICQGASDMLEVEASQSNVLATPVGFTYRWSPSKPNTGANVYNVNAPGVFTVHAENALGCISATKTLQVTQAGALQLSVSPDVEVCKGEEVRFTAQASNGVSSYIYTWAKESGTLVQQGANSELYFPFFNQATGDYQYTVSATDGCSTPATKTVRVKVKPSPTIGFTGLALNACVPVSPTLIDTAAGLVNHLWKISTGESYANQSPLSFTINKVGSYNVTLVGTNTFGCTDSLTKANYINAYPYPKAAIAYQPNELDVYHTQVQFINKTNIPNCSFKWQVVGINKTDTLESFNYGLYYNLPGIPGVLEVNLMAVSQFGCAHETTLLVPINNAYRVYIPNTFTPDGDGYNETFIPIFDNVLPNEYSFKIWDRWGELVFETESMFEAWDGTYHGELVQSGVFIYQVYFTNVFGEQQSRFGHVNVLR